MRLSRFGNRLAYAGLATGAIAAAVLAAPGAAVAATISTLVPAAGPTGTLVTATASASFTGDAVGVMINPTSATCPATYNVTSPNVAAGNVTKTGAATVTFTVPTSLTLGTSNATKPYYVCLYNGTTAGTSTVVNDTSGGNTFTLTPGGALSPNNGATGGGNTVTFTLPTSAAILPTAPGVAINPNGCASAYNGSGNLPTAAAPTRTSTTVLSAVIPTGALATGLSTPYYFCVYANRTSGALIASGTVPYNVTVPATTLSQPIGPSGTSTNLTITSASSIYSAYASPYALFIASPTTAPTTCPTLFTNTSTFVTPLRKLAGNKVALSLPSGPVISGSDPTPFNICQYSSNSTTTGRLLSVATYTIAAVPTLVSVSPNRGSALGGQTITVTGTNFPTTGLTATLGGTALTGITVLDPNTFTAVTPAHAVGAVTLAISTPVGSDTLSGAFTYANSILVSPNTAPNSVTAQDVDVQGNGFLDYNFAANAKVYLVDGVYNDRRATGSTNKTNGPVANCGSVLVISDVELVCSLNLTVQLDATGTAVPSSYRTSATGTSVAASNVLTLATGSFTQNDVGLPIGGTLGADFGTDPVIVAVTSPTTAVVSNPATAGISSAAAVTIGYQSSSITASGTSSNYTVTGAAGVFTQADVGRVATGTGVGTNAVVTAVDPTGATATLSVANSGSVSAVTLTSGNPVPNGAYNITVVSDGVTANASTTTGYKQTEISSGSTFTVAPF